MVTIKAIHRQTGANGPFFIFEAHGNMEIIQSQTTGNFYATSKKCFIPTALNYQEAEKLVGTSFPEAIKRVSCNPYEYTIEATGEVLLLAHTYIYVPGEP